VLVALPPAQSAATLTTPWKVDEYTIGSMSRIDLKARVLSKAYYRFGREVALSRYDLALGWGPMSDQAVVDQLSISQSNRWYRWHYQKPPLDEKQMIANSGNFHIIPANDQIRATLNQLRIGHIIKLQGQLVHVKAPDGWRWRSSLSRTDTGVHSCELVWVEQLSIEPIQTKTPSR